MVERRGEKEDSTPPYSITVPDTSWQHNWLFRKQMQANMKSSATFPPVSMLVPNPVLVTKTQIGNKDYDLVSELSERASVVSFDNSSVSQSGSECDEEMVESRQESRQEGEEADQEYTIYDLLPPARLPQAGLAWLSVPSDVTTHQGKIVTLHCAVQGDKPIGEVDSGHNLPLMSFLQMWPGLKSQS